MSNPFVKAEELKRYLDFGMRLSGNIAFMAEEYYTFQCKFIGLKEDNYLIFELGSKVMEDLITRKTTGLDIIIRGFADTDVGHVIAFKSHIMSIKTIGSWLLFIQYPNRIESKPIRTSKRFKVDISADVYVNDRRYAARFIDISVSGCALFLKEDSIDIKIGNEVIIEPDMTHIPKPYPKSTVVNMRRHGGGLIIGVALEKKIVMNDDLRLEVLNHVIESAT